MIALFVINLSFNVAEAACTTQGFEITAPEDGEVINGDNYEITWSDPACDAGETAEVWLHWTGSDNKQIIIYPIDANTQSGIFDTTTWSEDEQYWLSVVFNNGVDFFEHTSSNVFEIDNRAPDRVTMTLVEGPRPDRWDYGKSNNPDVTFHWSAANDDGPAEIASYSVQCFGGQGVEVLGPDVREYTCNFDEGVSNRLLISATDDAGNRGDGTYYGDYWIDTTAPTHTGAASVDANDGDTYIMIGDQIRFSIDGLTDGEGAGVKRMKFYPGGQGMWPGAEDVYVNSNPYTPRDPTAPAEDPTDYEYITEVLTDLNENTYRVSYWFDDWAGNSVILPFDELLILDKTMPEIVSVEYRDDDMAEGDHGNEGWIVGDGDTMTITAEFSDDSGIRETTPQLAIDCPTDLGDVSGSMSSTADNLVWTYEYAVGDWDLNEYCSVTIAVDDRAGNIFEQTFDEAILQDNIAPILTDFAISPGYYNVGNTVYLAYSVTEDNRYYPRARIIDNHNSAEYTGDGSNREMDTEDVVICNQLFGREFDHCYSAELDGTEGQDATLHAWIIDLAGNRDDENPIVHTDFIAPSTPVMQQPGSDPWVTKNQDFLVGIYNPSLDDMEHHWKEYQKKINGEWISTDEMPQDGFQYDLNINAETTLCLRGMDRAGNPSDESCTTVLHDNIPPPAVADLMVYDAVPEGTVTLKWSGTSSDIYYYEIYTRELRRHSECFTSIYDDDVEKLNGVVAWPGDELLNVPNLDMDREYCFAVVPYDTVGNIITDVNAVVGRSYPNEQVELVEGLNLISTPVVLANNNIAEVFAPVEDELAIVWHYDAVTGTWVSWAPNAEEDFNTLTTFDHGKAYLVDMYDTPAAELELAGIYTSMLGSMSDTGLPIYNVYSGWNMIGYTKSGRTSESTAEEYFGLIEGNYKVYQRVTTPELDLVTPTDMTAGIGYWVAVTGEEIVA